MKSLWLSKASSSACVLDAFSSSLRDFAPSVFLGFLHHAFPVSVNDFHEHLNTQCYLSLTQSPSLDKTSLFSYCIAFLLTFIGKILQRVVYPYGFSLFLPKCHFLMNLMRGSREPTPSRAFFLPLH